MLLLVSFLFAIIFLGILCFSPMAKMSKWNSQGDGLMGQTLLRIVKTRINIDQQCLIVEQVQKKKRGRKPKRRNNKLKKINLEWEQQNQNLQQSKKKSKFSIEEDKLILSLVNTMGPNFNKIVKYLPGKTFNMVKNRYYKRLRYVTQNKGDSSSYREEFVKRSFSELIEETQIDENMKEVLETDQEAFLQLCPEELNNLIIYIKQVSSRKSIKKTEL